MRGCPKLTGVRGCPPLGHREGTAKEKDLLLDALCLSLDTGALSLQVCNHLRAQLLSLLVQSLGALAMSLNLRSMEGCRSKRLGRSVFNLQDVLHLCVQRVDAASSRRVLSTNR